MFSIKFVKLAAFIALYLACICHAEEIIPSSEVSTEEVLPSTEDSTVEVLPSTEDTTPAPTIVPSDIPTSSVDTIDIKICAIEALTDLTGKVRPAYECKVWAPLFMMATTAPSTSPSGQPPRPTGDDGMRPSGQPPRPTGADGMRPSGQPPRPTGDDGMRPSGKPPKQDGPINFPFETKEQLDSTNEKIAARMAFLTAQGYVFSSSFVPTVSCNKWVTVSIPKDLAEMFLPTAAPTSSIATTSTDLSPPKNSSNMQSLVEKVLLSRPAPDAFCMTWKDAAAPSSLPRDSTGTKRDGKKMKTSLLLQQDISTITSSEDAKAKFIENFKKDVSKALNLKPDGSQVDVTNITAGSANVEFVLSEAEDATTSLESSVAELQVQVANPYSSLYTGVVTSSVDSSSVPQIITATDSNTASAGSSDGSGSGGFSSIMIIVVACVASVAGIALILAGTVIYVRRRKANVLPVVTKNVSTADDDSTPNDFTTIQLNSVEISAV